MLSVLRGKSPGAEDQYASEEIRQALLSQFDYLTLMEQVSNIAQQNPEVEAVWEYLSTETGRQWLEKVLELAQNG